MPGWWRRWMTGAPCGSARWGQCEDAAHLLHRKRTSFLVNATERYGAPSRGARPLPRRLGP